MESVAEVCPGVVELAGHTWHLALPPNTSLLLYGPSYMSEVVASIVAFNAGFSDLKGAARADRECNVLGAHGDALERKANHRVPRCGLCQLDLLFLRLMYMPRRGRHTHRSSPGRDSGL